MNLDPPLPEYITSLNKAKWFSQALKADVNKYKARKWTDKMASEAKIAREIIRKNNNTLLWHLSEALDLVREETPSRGERLYIGIQIYAGVYGSLVSDMSKAKVKRNKTPRVRSRRNLRRKARFPVIIGNGKIRKMLGWI